MRIEELGIEDRLKLKHGNTIASSIRHQELNSKDIFTNISRIFMNFRGRCHPDMFHSDHQQINKKRQKKTKWTKYI